VARLDNEGSLHYHVLIFFTFLFIFVTLKNLDFGDFRDSPSLTETQITFIQILYVILIFLVTLVGFRGYLIKTPEYATRGMFALVIATLGMFIILFNLLWDPLVNNQDYEIGGLGTVSMAISSIMIASGMVVYISIKFTEDRQQKWFIQAVKDEIERVEVSEYPSRARAPPRVARRQARAQKQVYTQQLPQPSNSPMLPPSTTPTQQAPSISPQPSSQVGTPTPGAGTGSPKIIKCPQCTVPLKVPNVPQRPLNIRCPHCGAIGTVYD